jgi:hypothetical protein
VDELALLAEDRQHLDGLRLADGTVAPLDVVFAEPELVAMDKPLKQLGVERAETPFGSWTAVDAFLHSPVELPREEILRRAASAVAPGGRLLVVGHGAFPPGSSHSDHEHDAPPLPTPDEVLASLALPDGWEVETNALVDRPVPWRDGTTLTLGDTVLRVRRRG